MKKKIRKNNLCINEEEIDDIIPNEVCIIINPGKNFDG